MQTDMCKAGPGRAGPRPADRPSLNSGRFGLKISQNLSAGPASASEICRPTGRSACRPVSEHQAPTITDRQQRKHTPNATRFRCKILGIIKLYFSLQGFVSRTAFFAVENTLNLPANIFLNETRKPIWLEWICCQYNESILIYSQDVLAGLILHCFASLYLFRLFWIFVNCRNRILFLHEWLDAVFVCGSM